MFNQYLMLVKALTRQYQLGRVLSFINNS